MPLLIGLVAIFLGRLCARRKHGVTLPPPRSPRYRVLDVKINAIKPGEAVRTVLGWIGAREKHYLSTCAPPT